MKVEDIREMGAPELETRLQELREEQFKLRFQASMMQVENPSLIKKIRRDIARIKTVLRERELARNG
jgi:large subunit ribosomal protein L29